MDDLTSLLQVLPDADPNYLSHCLSHYLPDCDRVNRVLDKILQHQLGFYPQLLPKVASGPTEVNSRRGSAKPPCSPAMSLSPLTPPSSSLSPPSSSSALQQKAATNTLSPNSASRKQSAVPAVGELVNNTANSSMYLDANHPEAKNQYMRQLLEIFPDVDYDYLMEQIKAHRQNHVLEIIEIMLTPLSLQIQLQKQQQQQQSFAAIIASLLGNAPPSNASTSSESSSSSSHRRKLSQKDREEEDKNKTKSNGRFYPVRLKSRTGSIEADPKFKNEERNADDIDEDWRYRMADGSFIFRSHDYIKGARHRLYNEFPAISKGTIRAIMAECRDDYLVSRERLHGLNSSQNSSWWPLAWSIFHRRAIYSSEYMLNSLLVNDVDLLHRHQRLKMVQEDAEVARAWNAKQYEECGQSIECDCCVTECSFEEMVACEDGHLFCKRCLRSVVEQAVYQRQGNVPVQCFYKSAEPCKRGFSDRELKRALSPTLMRALAERVVEEKVLTTPGVNWLRCPFCSYAAIEYDDDDDDDEHGQDSNNIIAKALTYIVSFFKKSTPQLNATDASHASSNTSKNKGEKVVRLSLVKLKRWSSKTWSKISRKVSRSHPLLIHWLERLLPGPFGLAILIWRTVQSFPPGIRHFWFFVFLMYGFLHVAVGNITTGLIIITHSVSFFHGWRLLCVQYAAILGLISPAHGQRLEQRWSTGKYARYELGSMAIFWCILVFAWLSFERRLQLVALIGISSLVSMTSMVQPGAEMVGLTDTPIADLQVTDNIKRNQGLVDDDLDDDDDMVSFLQCRNPKCGLLSCRRCKSECDPPHVCHEQETESLRTYVERAMSEALMRTCPRCQIKFCKSDGCNKMVCKCNYVMCYVCRSDIQIEGYNHFCNHFRYPPPALGMRPGPCTQCKKCDLYYAPDDEDIVRAAGERARDEYLRQHPTLRGILRNMEIGPREFQINAAAGVL